MRGRCTRFAAVQVKRRFERANEVLGAAALSRDIGFLRRARRTLLPLPLIDRPREIDASAVFPPFTERPVNAFDGKRVALVASGGSGAAVALVGVARAFEEAGITPAPHLVLLGRGHLGLDVGRRNERGGDGRLLAALEA